MFLEAWRRSADCSAERGSVRAWLLVRVRSRALDRLKSAGRSRVVSSVLVLGYFEGLSAVEIAHALGVPLGTVKSRTRAALGALRTVLGTKHE